MNSPSSHHPQSAIRDLQLALIFSLAAVIFGCERSQETVLIGQPSGPYRLELTVRPAEPQVGQEASLSYRVAETATGQPVRDLQVLHERILHTFIVSRDFKTFAHRHHEDFFSLTPQDLATATFHFPYTFPQAGAYLIVSEFTHKDRSWVKQFTVNVGGEWEQTSIEEDRRREKTFGQYQVSLRTSPDPPVAGYDTELVYHITKDGVPVTDLGLYLGTEIHMASWRLDGEHFGHQHTYTPEMAAMMAMMRDHTSNPNHMAQMMVQLMRGPAKQVYTGPDIPVHHVFPAAGTYKLFFETAPGGKVLVADFMVKVVEYDEGIDTTIHSIVPPPDSPPSPVS